MGMSSVHEGMSTNLISLSIHFDVTRLDSFGLVVAGIQRQGKKMGYPQVSGKENDSIAPEGREDEHDGMLPKMKTLKGERGV